MLELWTDGSAVPNPGKGGFAVILDGKPVVLGNEDDSTNIRMEGMALIAAMEYGEKHGGGEYKIYTDSEFWVNVLTKWAGAWEAKGWKKAKGEIKNLEIVQKMYTLYKKGGVKLEWTRGHVGTEMNELADHWANRAREGEKVIEKDKKLVEEGEG